MQTRRRTLALASESSSKLLKPSLDSSFKKSKARASTRSMVEKPASLSNASTAVTRSHSVKKTLSSALAATVIDETTRKVTISAVSKTTTKKTTKTKTATATETMTVTTTAAMTAKVEKSAIPEEDPWKKRHRHVPSYAKEALEHLRQVDPALAPLIKRYPYEIYADHDTNYFRILCRTILGQQIHWKAARSIIYKFVSFYFPDGQVTLESLDKGDKTFPTPEQVLSTRMEQLRQCGISERKASYMQDLAQHFVDGKITFTDKAALQALTDKELGEQLLCVRGIGPWTVDMFLMHTLERLDILPTLDLGVRKGMEKHFASSYKNGVWGAHLIKEDMDNSSDEDKTKKKKKSAPAGKGKAKKGEMTIADMERMADIWRPYRSIASWYMWRNADEPTITAPI
ncbi:hypothetical protein BGZ94_005798 [Podila epigama]|nr:hypothetical protein BGZ94_005798 [Podila epigama]